MTDVPTLQELTEQRLRDLGARGKPMSPREAARRAAGQVSYETLRLIAKGVHSGRLDEATMRGLALALDVPYSRVYQSALRTTAMPPPPFEVPDRANRLTYKQRRLVLQVIDTLLDPGETQTSENVTPLRQFERRRPSPAAEEPAPIRRAARKVSPRQARPGTQEQTSP